METDIVTHVVLVTGLVQKGNKYLIARRSLTDPQAPGAWSVPGGKVDTEVGPDIILTTLKREILEEVGLEIEDKVWLYRTDAFIRVSGHHVVGLHFLCRYKAGIAKPLEDQKEVKWMNLKELTEYKEFNKFNQERFKDLEKFLKNK